MKKCVVFIVVYFSIGFVFSQCCVEYKDVFSNKEVINTYYPPVAGSVVDSGATKINLSAVPKMDQFGNSYGITPIASGDLLLIIQMQGASFDASDQIVFGSGSNHSGPDSLGATGITALNNVGNYEFVIAKNDVPLSGGELIINEECSNGGVKHTYTNKVSSTGVVQQSFQVIRVPRFQNLTLTQDLTTSAWNGTVGGVLALFIVDTLDLNSFSISADGKGFRGGFQNVRHSGQNNVLYTTTDINLSSGKGEGICGTPRFLWNGQDAVDNGANWFGYEGGNFGRGAPGNAGGGGNNHNAGGGGGGGFGAGGVGGNGWAGAGINFPNGGRPGIGLRLNYDRLVMGGGGGGGDANNALSGIKGGAGGGIVFVISGYTKGEGKIVSSGSNGQVGIYGTAPDGAGGGGGGGSILFHTQAFDKDAKVVFEAIGGKGGNTLNDNNNFHGPGGGGGGGMVFQNISKNLSFANINGGLSGIAADGAGIPNGAKPGQKGALFYLDSSVLIPDKSMLINPKPLADFEFQFVCHTDTTAFFCTSTAFGSSIIVKRRWNFGDGRHSTMNNPVHVYSTPGKYIVQLIVETQFGCSDTIQKEVEIFPLPSVSLLPAGPFCENDNDYQLIHYGKYDGYFYGSSLVDSLGLFSPSKAGRYVLFYQEIDTHQCIGIDSVIVMVNSASTSDLKVNSCDSFYWDANNEVYTTSGMFSTILRNSNGCDSVIHLELTVNPSFLIERQEQICSNQFFTLPDGRLVNSPGQYPVYFKSALGCDSIVLTTLKVNQSYFSTIYDTICEFQSYILPDGKTVVGPGVYDCLFSTSNQCDSIIRTVLIQDNQPRWLSLFASPNPAILDFGRFLNLQVRSNYSGNIQYYWEPAIDLSCDQCPNPVFSGRQSRTYVVTGITDDGCYQSIEVPIVVRGENLIYYPNVFSPNNNGMNEVFKPGGFGVESSATFYLAIYNRWGELLFETLDPSVGWDGTFMGVDAQECVYVYYSKVTLLNGEKKEYKGTVTLLR
jgi:gliding motility-associated-like protein